MSVQFSFGTKLTQTLPDAEDSFKKIFAEYLSKDSDDQNFREFFKRALRDAQVKGTYDELTQEFSKVLEKTIKDKELSLQMYKEDADAYSEYIRGDENERAEAIKFAEENSLFDILTDSKKYNQMIGETSLTLGRDVLDLAQEKKLPKLDIDEFLALEDLNESYIEFIHDSIVLNISLGKPAKTTRNMYEAYNGDMKTLMAIPKFVDSLNINYSLIKSEEDAKYDFDVEVPEQSDTAKVMADKLRNYYVEYIRDTLGIKSGGFIPEGSYYTRGVESSVEYRPDTKNTFTIDILSSKLEDELSYDNIMKKIESILPNHLKFDMPTNILEVDLTEDILEGIEESDSVQARIEDLSVITEIKLFHLKLTIRLNPFTKTEWKKGDKDKLLKKPLKEALLVSERRIAKIGRFDFSYYSKEGQIKKNKMNDHLNEIRTKLKYLKTNGVDGGI